jgi:DNA-3-methyladenine glycosylase II
VQERIPTQSSIDLPAAEQFLSSRDAVLAAVIISQTDRWPTQRSEDPIWGLIRIVMAQQVSTCVASRIAEQIKSRYPALVKPMPAAAPDLVTLRAMGLPQRRAECCIDVIRRSIEIRASVAQGRSWEDALSGIKGIGPWTLSVFRIMVLREPDELPLGDVGLERAIANVYGSLVDVDRLGETWRPFRSVACWYLWRTLGNEQLG